MRYYLRIWSVVVKRKPYYCTELLFQLADMQTDCIRIAVEIAIVDLDRIVHRTEAFICYIWLYTNGFVDKTYTFAFDTINNERFIFQYVWIYN